MSWTVDLSGECSGRFEHFILLSSALDFAHEHWEYPYIDLKHDGQTIRIKDNPEKKKGDKNCSHYWTGEFGHIKCQKCEAVVNIACNHTGSVGCMMCSQKYADEINTGKTKQPELYNLKENICPVCGLPNDASGACANNYCISKREGHP